jgi:hypothetical protein
MCFVEMENLNLISVFFCYERLDLAHLEPNQSPFIHCYCYILKIFTGKKIWKPKNLGYKKETSLECQKHQITKKDLIISMPWLPEPRFLS